MSKAAPNNIELEKQLLGLFYEFEDIRDYVILNISPDIFYSEKHKKIFIAGIDLYNKDEKFHIESFAHQLKENYGYITLECIGKLPSSEHAKTIISELSELAIKRKLLDLSINIQTHLEKNSSDKIIASTENWLSSIHNNGYKKVYHISEIIDQYSSEQSFNEMSQSCVISGIQSIDQNIIFKKGDFIILAGRPSMGKTAFALHLAKRMAKNNHKVGFVSIEMLSQYLIKRMAMSESQLKNYQGYKSGCESLFKLPIYINDNENTGIENVSNIIQLMYKRYAIEICFIDYLQLISGKGQSRYEQVTNLSNNLKWLAKKIAIPVITISQLSRHSEHRANHRPNLGDLRDSGAIEQDADIVMFCYRPGYYQELIEKHKNHKEKSNYEFKDIDDLERYFEIIIGKQREYITGVLKFYYERDRNYFTPMSNRVEDAPF
ncbi:MAG: DnaB-like helicase C-terminal domain-containing protein [Candidatus Hodarchaeota archaeon]